MSNVIYVQLTMRPGQHKATPHNTRPGDLLPGEHIVSGDTIRMHPSYATMNINNKETTDTES